MKYKIELDNIKQIRVGDTVLHGGKLRTVSGTDLSCGFMGICLFGDSYKLGLKPVKLVRFYKNADKNTTKHNA